MEVEISEGRIFKKILGFLLIEDDTTVILSFTRNDIYASCVSKRQDAKIAIKINSKFISKLENKREITRSVTGKIKYFLDSLRSSYN
jgi:hypothetical protein